MRKIIRPHTQSELLTGQSKPYRTSVSSRKNDTVKDATVKIIDIDNAIRYYFTKVVQPTVVEKGQLIRVPILYGKPSRWVTMRKFGYLRDKKNKAIVPLIMYRNSNIDRNADISMKKLDGSNPQLFYPVSKKWSQQNKYSNFSALYRASQVSEFYEVVVPDYITLSYEGVIWTNWVEQLNGIIEALLFSEDTYWGEENKFRFLTKFDGFSKSEEVAIGEDKSVKANFTMNVQGYIVTDAVNKELSLKNRNQKTFSSMRIILGEETELPTTTATLPIIGKSGAQPISIPAYAQPPTLNLPINGSSGESIYTVFDWSDVLDATNYKLQIATDVGFTSVVYSTENISNSSFTLPQDNPLSISITYYWRISSGNQYGYGSWSSVSNFECTSTLPGIPMLISPSDSAISQSLIPTFVWDISNGSTSYNFQLASDLGFTSLVTSSLSLLTTTLSLSSSLSQSATYYWRTQGVNSYGTSSWAIPYTFKANQILVPDTPSLTYPTGSIVVSGSYPDITFEWNVANNATTYNFQLSTSSFTDYFANKSGSTQTFYDTTPTSGSYKWRVQGQNSYGTSSWSSTGSFSTPSYLQESINLFSRMTIQPTDARKGLIDTLIRGLKTDGIWVKLDCFWMFAHETNTNYEAYLNWVKNSCNCSDISTPAPFIVDQGITPTVSLTTITNYIPSIHGVNYTLNNCMMGIYSRTNNVNAYSDIGYYGNPYTLLYPRYTGDIMYGCMNSTSNTAVGTVTDSRGLFILQRIDSLHIRGFRNATPIATVVQGSTALTNVRFSLGQAYPGFVTGRQLSCAFTGAFLTDVEEANFYNRIQTFMTAIGANV